MSPYIVDISRTQYEERLQEAEAQRLAKLVSVTHVNRLDRVRAQLGDSLIALGQNLKAPARPEPQFD